MSNSLRLSAPRSATGQRSHAQCVRPQASRALRLRAVPRQRYSLRTVAHGHGHGGSQAVSVQEPNKTSGFVAEMRKVAMKLHTREQAPKEGEQESKRPMQQFAPTREGYLQFLAESKAVYDTLERIMADAKDPQYERFQNTGLERSAPLAKDIAWMDETYGIKPKELTEEGPGLTYAKLLEDLAVSNPPAFICHYYNTYFAHTAGGRMIGNKFAGMCLDGAELEFYKYDGELVELLESVRGNLNDVAEGWSKEEKDVCLTETMDSFKYSGGIMSTIMSG